MLHEWIEFASQSMDSLAVAIMVSIIVVGTAFALNGVLRKD